MEKHDSLPGYARQLKGFHLAFEPELLNLLSALPLDPTMKVLDFACGDGFYARRLAERLSAAGKVTGVDLNEAYLEKARNEAEKKQSGADLDFVAASFDKLPFAENSFDFIWCAQSFFSLPDPVAALKNMRSVLKPGGLVAILENDSMHQLMLPWPATLELPLRAAELQAFLTEEKHAGRFYVGRRLPAVLAAGGFEPLTLITQAIDRAAPLGKAESVLLQSYLEFTADRVAPYLDEKTKQEFARLRDPNDPAWLFNDKYLTMTWLNVLAIGKRSSE